jgi:hypothetical protein
MTNCISLKTSVHCTEYSDFFIQIGTNFTNTQQFDTFVSQQILFQYGSTNCPSWPRPIQPIPMATSIQCAYAVYMSEECNPNKQFINLCQSSIDLTLEPLKKSIQTNCPNVFTLPVYHGVEEYRNFSKNSNCYLGIGKQGQMKCGLDSIEATTFCNQNPTQLCCITQGNLIPSLPKPTPVPNHDNLVVNPLYIVGAAIGLGLVILLLFTLVFVKKRIPKNKNSIPFKMTNKTLTCVFAYRATLIDELDLCIIFIHYSSW